MAIVSSTYTVDAHAQVDGRRYVTETHVDSTGAVHTFEYLASDAMNKNAILAARAVQLADTLAQQEYQDLTA